jgi:glycosyltransferase involved in cell wall biosynthesis
VSLGDTIRLAGRSAVRHPRKTWRRVSGQKLKAFARLLGAAPAPTRRRVGGILEAGARLLLARRGDDPIGAPLHVVAAWGSGQGPEALAWAEALGIAPETDARTALRLANASLALGEVEPARRIVEALAAAGRGDDTSTLTLRAEVALRSGRYRGAADLAERAVEAAGAPGAGSRGAGRFGARGAGRARAILRNAEGELRVLQPDWRPSLDAAAPRGPLAPVRGRVLHLLTNSLPYREAGYTLRTQSVARSQLDVGLDPHLATRAGFPLVDGVAGAPRGEVVDGVPYHRLLPDLEPGSGPDVLTTATARAAARLVRELRPAVLHPASNFLNAQVALTLRDRFEIPVVYEVRGFLEETWASRTVAGAGAGGGSEAEEADRYVGARAAETACMLAADAVVTLSETMRAEIVARGCDPANLVVIPNAVDIERFEPRPRDASLAASLGIEPGETVLGYVSTLNRMEGVSTLLEAAAILRARHHRIRVLLVGDGEERARLEARAGQPDLAGSVIFSGRVPHDGVTSYYSLIDVFVVPRTPDRVSQLVTPLKPFEAMALQRTLVVSDVAALKEIVTDGQTGHTFRAGDATNLADVVEPLLNDPVRRAELGAAAREWVAANRTWRQNGLKYRQLYERLGVA